MDVYTPADLLGVLESLENPPITFFRDRFFLQEIFSDKEEIFFDVVDKHRRLAPYVHPLSQGKLVEGRGYSTKMIKPAYVKPKSVINPGAQLKRRAGEALTGSLSPAERRDAQIRETIVEHDEMLQMREEVQCAEALRTGAITITGEGFGTINLAFGRDAALTVALAGAAQWDDVSQVGKTLAQLQSWALLVRQKSGGAIVRDVVMEPNAFSTFLSTLTDNQQKMLFDSLRGSESRVELGPRQAQKIKFEGRIGEFDFWTYNDTYLDEAGVEQNVMPTGSVVLASPAIEGVRCYGAIIDARSLVATRVFMKMWEQQDPSAEYLLTQSAPLMVPTRPNASFGATVI